MTLQEISILIVSALLLGLVSWKWQRANLLMISSIIFLYWLQPETALRGLGFWLPTAGLLITVISWVLTSSPEVRRAKGNLQTLVLIFSAVIVIGVLGLFDSSNLLGFVNPPRTWQAAALLFAGIGLTGMLVRSGRNFAASLWPSFVLIIALFVILKTPFLAQKASELWRHLSGQSLVLASPYDLKWLGFSYAAFRILHTIRDRQAGRLPDVTLREYLTFVIFFPALAAGPIAKLKDVADQIQTSTNTFQINLARGGERVIRGLFKKFVIADSLAVFALNSQNASHPGSPLGAWMLLYSFSLQIYFDFSGYTDIAIGLAKFLDIQLPENFNRPYLQTNLTQFWNNWHMTLTNWFRAYVFNPLSRSLRKKKHPVLVILLITQILTMVLVGLWHGVTINFVIWGIWHGLGLLIQNRWSSLLVEKNNSSQEPGRFGRIQELFGILLTFHYVTLGWIWFVLPTPDQGWSYLKILFGAGG
jgi:alginate O-acetyltransferase complex protein AlgI